jgi:NADP-dependent 3-hydroxy acid dehydrogenase YdfG
MGDRLDGTVALVTGASSGIGAATAVELAGQGAAVALVARRAERLGELAGRIRGGGETALVLTADVTVEQQARDVVARTVAELGPLDTLINNSGVMLLGPADALGYIVTRPRHVAVNKMLIRPTEQGN